MSWVGPVVALVVTGVFIVLAARGVIWITYWAVSRERPPKGFLPKGWWWRGLLRYDPFMSAIGPLAVWAALPLTVLAVPIDLGSGQTRWIVLGLVVGVPAIAMNVYFAVNYREYWRRSYPRDRSKRLSAVDYHHRYGGRRVAWWVLPWLVLTAGSIAVMIGVFNTTSQG